MRSNWLTNYNLLTFETVDSTNSEALRLASSGISGDLVILSKDQTGGRGQKGREWVSIPGNLYASILLDSDSNTTKHTQLSFVIANAMYDSIVSFAAMRKLSLNIELKWPNDILINGKKVSGILLESISFGSQNYVVIGVGVNIMEAPLLPAPHIPATSLFDEGIEIENAEDFLDVLIDNFDKLYTKWKRQNSFVNTQKKWQKHAYNLNKLITIDNGGKKISGVFKGIDVDGSMQLQLANGKIQNIFSGDIVLDKEE